MWHKLELEPALMSPNGCLDSFSRNGKHSCSAQQRVSTKQYTEYNSKYIKNKDSNVWVVMAGKGEGVFKRTAWHCKVTN